MPLDDLDSWNTAVESEFHIEGDYAPLLKQIGMDAETVFTDPRIHVWRSLPDRENATLDFQRENGKSIRLHVKRYPEPFHFMAKHEMEGYRLLKKAEIPVAPIIAHGNRSNKDSFIILEDLADYTPADKLIQQGFAFDRLLEVTADLAALLHNKRLHHRDLYLCHFMVKPTENTVDAKLIDFARVDRLNSVLTRRRWIIKDLGQFWYSTLSLPITDPQREQWLRRYCKQRQIKFDRFIGPVQDKAVKIGRHDKRLQLKQPNRNVSIAPPEFGQ
jgi:hypothetical protein